MSADTCLPIRLASGSTTCSRRMAAKFAAMKRRARSCGERLLFEHLARPVDHDPSRPDRTGETVAHAVFQPELVGPAIDADRVEHPQAFGPGEGREAVPRHARSPEQYAFWLRTWYSSHQPSGTDLWMKTFSPIFRRVPLARIDPVPLRAQHHQRGVLDDRLIESIEDARGRAVAADLGREVDQVAAQYLLEPLRRVVRPEGDGPELSRAFPLLPRGDRSTKPRAMRARSRGRIDCFPGGPPSNEAQPVWLGTLRREAGAGLCGILPGLCLGKPGGGLAAGRRRARHRRDVSRCSSQSLGVAGERSQLNQKA